MISFCRRFLNSFILGIKFVCFQELGGLGRRGCTLGRSSEKACLSGLGLGGNEPYENGRKPDSVKGNPTTIRSWLKTFSRSTGEELQLNSPQPRWRETHVL